MISAAENTHRHGHIDISALFSQRAARGRIVLLAMSVSLFLSILLATGIGAATIAPTTVAGILADKLLHPSSVLSSSYEAIVIDVRVPRVLMAALVGSGLATAGCALQGLFKNPMASPWILGVSSGAAFGASLAILLPISLWGMEVPAFAFLMALLTLFVVYHLSKVRGKTEVQTLVLVGIAIAFFFSALVSVMQYLAGDELRAITIWLMGSLSLVTWKHVMFTLPFIVGGILVIYSFSRQLNVMSLDETTALHLGIEAEKVKRVIMISAAVVTAIAVSFTGPIGFVGLIVPHIVRLLIGPDHRLLVPSSCLAGAIFLIWADTLARASMNEIPVGIITALFGCPFFIYLLRRRRKLMRTAI